MSLTDRYGGLTNIISSVGASGSVPILEVDIHRDESIGITHFNQQIFDEDSGES